MVQPLLPCEASRSRPPPRNPSQHRFLQAPMEKLEKLWVFNGCFTPQSSKHVHSFPKMNNTVRSITGTPHLSFTSSCPSLLYNNWRGESLCGLLYTPQYFAEGRRGKSSSGRDPGGRNRSRDHGESLPVYWLASSDWLSYLSFFLSLFLLL